MPVVRWGRRAVVSPTRIRERMAAITDAKERAGARAAEVVLTLGDIVAGTRITRGLNTIEFQASPAFIRDLQGRVIGFEVYVRVFRGATEIRVEAHRAFINPPCLVPDGTFHQVVDPITGLVRDVPNFREDPREAALMILVDSIRDMPNTHLWRPR